MLSACGQDASDFTAPPLPGNLDKAKWDLSAEIYPRDLNFAALMDGGDDLGLRDGGTTDLQPDLRTTGDHPDMRNADQQ
jgi:hypothetical protein